MSRWRRCNRLITARLDEEDDDGDIPIIGLTGSGYWDFREFGGTVPADKSSNTNESDVNFVVPGVRRRW